MAVSGGNAIDHNLAYAGMLADLELSNLVSKLNKGTDEIAFGLGVITDGEDGATVSASEVTAVSTFVGVVHRDLNYVTSFTGTEQDNIARDMSIVTKGVVWVDVTGQTPAKDEDVYLLADGVFGNSGTTAIPNAKFLGAKITDPNGREIAKVSFGLGG